MSASFVVGGVLALSSLWVWGGVQGGGVIHSQDEAPEGMDTAGLWDYIGRYEARDDVTQSRPPLIHDVAWLTLNVSTAFDVEVWAQSQQCWKCPMVYVEEVTSHNTTTILVNTTFTTDIKFVRKRPGGFSEDICGLTVAFREHGNYWLFLDYSTAMQKSPCVLLMVNDPPPAEMPILYVALGLLGMAVLVAVAFKLHGCLRNKMYERNSASISDPNHHPDNDNAAVTSSGLQLTNLEKEDAENGAGQPTPAEVTEAPVEKKSPRLKSLDTFRGLSLMVMVFVNYGGGGYWFFEHPPWNGLTVADLVFPWFVFMMGTSMTFSFKGMFKRGMTSWAIALKVIIRSAKLFALGIILNSSWGPVDLTAFRIPGVLQRLALTYLVTALLKLLFYRHTDPYQKRRWAPVRDVVLCLPEWITHLMLLTLYLSLTYALPVPGCPTGYTGPGGLSEGGSHTNCTGGAAQYIDVMVLGESHLYQYPTPQEIYQTTVAYDPEGILGTLTSVFLCFLGVQSGNILSIYREPRSRVVRWLLWALITGVPAVILSKCSQNDGWIPVNKNLWSLSFVLTTGSFAFLVLTAMYLVIDVWGWWGGQPFIFPGMNSIVVYFCHDILWRVLPINWEVEEVHWKLLLQDVWGAAVWILFAYILFRKKIFIAL